MLTIEYDIIKIGCDLILNTDKIKHFQTEFKQRVKDEELYDPIYKSFSKELRTFKPFFKQMSDLEQHKKSLFSSYKQIIEDDFLTLENKYIKANETIVEKNTQEILEQHKILLKKQQDIKNDYSLKHSQITEERLKLQQDIESKINEATLKMNKELSELDQLYKTQKNENNRLVQEIEDEFDLTKTNLQLNFEKNQASYELQKQDIQQKKLVALEKTTQLQEDEKSKNNDIYVNIKKVFNDANIEINKKINYLTKVYQRSLSKLDKIVEKKCDPISDNIEVLKNSYQSKVNTLKETYVKNLENIDTSFNQRYQDYEDKKVKINKEAQEAISIFNSKLTNNRESFEEEKNLVLKTYHNNILNLEEKEITPLRKKMKSKLRSLENDFNRLIIQTQKDILRKKKELHQRLHQHETKFLNDKYQLRLEKLILTNEYHHQVKKLDTNFQYNLDFANQKKQLYQKINQTKKEILSHTLNQDILPLETQMTLQSLVQERELNLLNHDQQIALNVFKIDILNIEHEYQLALEKLLYLEEKNKFELESELLVLNTNTQLELEKTKILREDAKSDKLLRKTLAKTMHERQVQQIQYHNHKQNMSWDFELKMKEIHMLHEQLLAKRKETLIYHKRTSFMRDADVKTKSRLLQNKVIKSMRMYKNNVELEQFEIEKLTSILVFSHQRIENMYKIIVDLYNLPAHPEVFKKLVDLFNLYINDIYEILNASINEKQQYILSYLENENKAKDFYKSTLKHEYFKSFYTYNIEQYHVDIEHFKNDIKYIESLLLNEEAKKERHQSFIVQLEKIKDTFNEQDDNKIDLQSNDQLIRKHKHDIHTINAYIKVYEQEIRRHQTCIHQLNHKKSALEKQLHKEERLYQARLKNNDPSLISFIKQYKTYYKKLNTKLNFVKYVFSGFDQYLNQSMFMTDKEMHEVEKDFKKKINLLSSTIMVEQQKQLNLIKHYQEIQLDKNALILADIKDHEMKSLKLLHQSSSLFDQMMHYTFDKQQKLYIYAKDDEQSSYNKQLSHFEISYQTNNTLVKDKLHQQEKSLQVASNEVQLQLKTINENQHEIALQYLNNAKERYMSLEDKYLKTVKQITSTFDKKVSDIKHFNITLDKKNQLLLDTYLHDQKELEQHKSIKVSQLKQKINHEHFKIKTFKSNYQKTQKTSFKKRDALFRNYKSDLRQQNRISSKQESKALQKDIKEERQSYLFKIKSLKLHKVKSKS